MKTAAIIAEYNPFHNGHEYHLKEAKKQTEADYVIAIMSGSFVQRGIPAITDKHTRARMALECGADVVFELPCIYAAASAELFAMGAVSILDRLNTIDYLVFGSESENLPLIKEIAGLLSAEPAVYQAGLKMHLAKGDSFPAARQKALMDYFPARPHNELSKVLSSSNSILAIEYQKALFKINSPIRPVAIKRTGASYNDPCLPEGSLFPSATALRKAYNKTGSLSQFTRYTPKQVSGLLMDLEGKQFPIYLDDFSEYLYYRLLTSDWQALCQYSDVSQDLARRIRNELPQYRNISSFAKRLKTRQYTLTRIQRALLHIMLGIKKEDSLPVYGRLLGFRKKSAFLIDQKKASMPIVTKAADHKSLIEQDVFTTQLYNRVIFQKFHYSMKNDYTHPLVIIP